MKNYIKKSIALVLVFAFSFSSALSVNATGNESDNNSNNLVPVVILETDSQVIIAQVPADKVEEYQEDLKDPDFRQSQIDQCSPHSTTRALPDGEIMAQRYMYRSTVENIVDSNLGQGYFASFLTGPVTDAAVAALIKKAGFSSVVAFAASALLWGINELRVKPDEWWTDSLLMIIKKQISCVRLSHIRNTGTSYPAAWLILERI